MQFYTRRTYVHDQALTWFSKGEELKQNFPALKKNQSTEVAKVAIVTRSAIDL